jgi:hypothetical protein
MAKRAMDVASRELDREAAVHVQAHCLRSCLGANRFAAKDCRAVFIEQRFLTPGHHEVSRWWPFRILTNEYCGGEFMRSFIAVMALAAIAGGAAVAAEQSPKADAPASALFSEDGIYIAPGESQEIVIAGDCRLLTNRHARIGYYITPALHDAWPDEKDRAPLEPVVTEAPCK